MIANNLALMRPRFVTALSVLALSAGLTLGIATPAMAAPDMQCESTGWQVPDGFPGNGLATASYVGSFWTVSATFRIFHFTYVPYSGTTSYTGAAAYRCDSQGQMLGYIDLTRTMLTAASHPQCGTTSYNVGSNSYTYIGTRSNSGDRFRYWGQVVYSGMFLLRSPTAVRCD